MVTLPSEAAENYQMVFDLINNGMKIARINTAHDDINAWKSMVSNVKKASKMLRKNTKIYMDLAEPKIRSVVKSEKDKGILLKESDMLRIILELGTGIGSGKENIIGITIPK